MPIWRLGSAVPRVHPSAFVHPAAQLIGNVVVHERASIWPGAVLRADFGRIEVGAGSSVQDNCVVHPGSSQPTVVGRDCIVGHAVHLEGVLIEDGVLVGSGAILLQGCRVRTGGAVAAGALLTKATDVPPGRRAQGVPARLVAHDADRDGVVAGAREYERLARRYVAELAEEPASLA